MTLEQARECIKEESLLAPMMLPDILLPKERIGLEGDSATFYDYLAQEGRLAPFLSFERKVKFLIEESYGKKASPLIYLPYPNVREREILQALTEKSEAFPKKYKKYTNYLGKASSLFYDKCCNYFLDAVKNENFEKYLLFVRYARELRSFVKSENFTGMWKECALWPDVKKYIDLVSREKGFFLSEAEEEEEVVVGTKVLLQIDEKYLYELFSQKNAFFGFGMETKIDELTSLWSLYAYLYDYAPESAAAPLERKELEALLVEMDVKSSAAFREFKDSLKKSFFSFKERAYSLSVKSYTDIEKLLAEFAIFVKEEGAISVENILEEQFLKIAVTDFLLEFLLELLQEKEQESNQDDGDIEIETGEMNA